MKPLVYNANYYMAHALRRIPHPTGVRKPWFVSVGSRTKKFRTHAKAIAYADKMAREGAKP